MTDAGANLCWPGPSIAGGALHPCVRSPPFSFTLERGGKTWGRTSGERPFCLDFRRHLLSATPRPKILRGESCTPERPRSVCTLDDPIRRPSPGLRGPFAFETNLGHDQLSVNWGIP